MPVRRNIVAASIGLVLLAYAGQAVGQSSSPEAPVTVEHRKFFTRGSYSAFAIAFSAMNTDLAAGRDYDAIWTLKRSSFPADSVLNWYVPAGPIPNKKGVWGYFHIAYGNYEGNRQQIPVIPRKVGELNAFESGFGWSYSGTNNFTLLHELFLTRVAKPQPQWVNGPDFALEVGFFLHSPEITRTFHLKGKPVGPDHQNGGVTYSVRRNGNYVTFAPAGFAEQLEGRIDWKAALTYLVAQGVITGSEYVNGVALGVEPTLGGGKGQLTVKRYEVTLK